MNLQICRFSLAFIWIYQGLVPKWLGPHPDELAMSLAAGATPAQGVLIARGGGTLEILLGLALLLWPRARPLYVASGLAILAFQAALMAVAPGFLVSAFNGMTMHVAIGALSLIAWQEAGARPAWPMHDAPTPKESRNPLNPLAGL